MKNTLLPIFVIALIGFIATSTYKTGIDETTEEEYKKIVLVAGTYCKIQKGDSQMTCFFCNPEKLQKRMNLNL